ncbi:MAG TPA: MFS transporter [Pseudonocardia sp.]|nr:MFS transporter [Pseudonocardia sp.]
MSTEPPDIRRPSPRAWLVWSVGVLGYVLAVAQRTTFGVAGLDAADRFAIDPGTLSAFVFIQLAVYIAAQIPAGLLVDRYGSRATLVASGILLAAGQLLLAFTAVVPLAVLARVLVGAGDAIVFSAVFSLVPRWFPGRRVPVYAQLTGMLCQFGQVLSAVPFAALLHSAGWTTAFGAAAAVSAVGAGLAFLVVRNAPTGAWAPVGSMSPGEIGRQLRAVWHRPGTRVGFFGHLGSQFSMMVFTMLWGVPYLQTAQQLSAGAIGALLTLFVLCMIGIGPVLGVLATRHPMRRSWLVLGVIGAEATVWTVVLAQPGPAPTWLLVLLIVVLAAAGPGSMVGIDISRTSNPSGSLGIAQSMTNLGGFLASLVVLAGMGAIMTAMGGFTPEAFRMAWLLQYPVWAIAVVGLLLNRRQARALDAQRGVVPRRVRDVLAGVRR